MDIISATNKVNFSNYEKLFWHFEFGNDHLLIEVILANMYDFEAEIDGKRKVQGIIRETQEAVTEYNNAIEVSFFFPQVFFF